jgi:hypothetical protein
MASWMDIDKNPDQNKKLFCKRSFIVLLGCGVGQPLTSGNMEQQALDDSSQLGRDLLEQSLVVEIGI